jgi:hypothetical protein
MIYPYNRKRKVNDEEADGLVDTSTFWNIRGSLTKYKENEELGRGVKEL